MRRALAGGFYRFLQDRFPRAYLRLVLRRGADLHPLTADCDLVIAGAPGSANSYVRAACLAANPGLRIASHAHVWTEVPDALRLGLPVVLLVRDPRSAVASRMTRFHTDSPRQALRSYARYYRRLLPYRDRVVVGDFRDVTARPGDVARRLNEHFGTAFVPFPHEDQGAMHDLHAMLTSANGAVPSDDGRAAESRAARRALGARQLTRLHDQCQDLYERMTEAQPGGRTE